MRGKTKLEPRPADVHDMGTKNREIENGSLAHI